MRRTLSLLVPLVVVVALFAALPASSGAVLTCPDDMVIVPRTFVQQGERKDKNMNTFVCARPTNCLQSTGSVCHGGPDDDEVVGTETLGVPLLGDDGKWYYVIDDV